MDSRSQDPRPLTKAEVAATLAGLTLGVLMSALDNTVVAAAMPTLVDDLGGSELYHWPFTLYLLTSTLAIPVFGRLADQLGRRTVFLAGLAEFIVASVLCGLAPDMGWFVAFRALQGLGGGILVSNAFALAAEISTPSNWGAALGLIGAMFGIAGLLGPSVGGLLAEGPGWRWAFFLNLPLGFATLAVLVFGLRHLTEMRLPLALDPWSVALFCASVAPLLVALGRGAASCPGATPRCSACWVPRASWARCSSWSTGAVPIPCFPGGCSRTPTSPSREGGCS